jgi:hypothetical protein
LPALEFTPELSTEAEFRMLPQHFGLAIKFERGFQTELVGVAVRSSPRPRRWA